MGRRLLVILLLALLAGVACNSKPVITTVSPLVSPVSPLIVSSATAALASSPMPLSTPVPPRTSARPSVKTPTPPSIAPLPGLVYYLPRGIRDGEYWKVGDDGQAAILFRGSSSYWGDSLSAEGNFLLQHDAGHEGGIWLVDLTTGKRSNLTLQYGGYICCARWWAGQPNKILLGSWQTGDDVTISHGYLTELELDSMQLRVLDSDNFYFDAASSPDGKVVAYNNSQGDGWLYQEDKPRHTFKPEQYGLTAEGAIGVGNPSWSPNGEQLAWVVAGDFASTGKRYGVAVFDLKQKTARLLHSYQIGGTDVWPPAALWSPDGQWLAFNAVAEADDYGLWAASADGTEKHHLAQDLRSVAWSPDSRFLVFTTSGPLPKAWITEVGNWQLQPFDLPVLAEVVAWINPNQ